MIISRLSSRPIITTVTLWTVVTAWSFSLYGCMAQQADVVRIKRELDAKISQLDKSRNSLQDAVGEANQSLEQAGTIIAKQRAEIKELVQARAEVMDQMARLKDRDLSQVRGAIEKNDHHVDELSQRFGKLDNDVQAVRNQVRQSQAMLEPLVSQVRERLGAGEQLLTEQGGKLGEFRSSLVEYQQALETIRQSLLTQEQSVAELRAQMERMGQTQQASSRQVQANFDEVRRSIQSVIGTLEKVGTTFGSRLDEHEQQLNRMAGQSRSVPGRLSQQSFVTETPDRLVDARPPLYSQDLSAFQALNRVPVGSSGSNAAVTGSSTVDTKRVRPSIPISASPSVDQEMGSLLSGVPSRDLQASYDEAFQLLRQGDYPRAMTEFAEFLRMYPESPLAANAQYWLAECYYGQRRFPEAIDEFERVFLLYPSSNKVPAALLKIAYSHLERQDAATARSVLQQLIRVYPQSPEARKAQVRLRDVNALLRKPS